jgi:DNA replication and repair protein RecF
MLKLDSISVFQFKNYSSGNFVFSERVIGICGPNGVGKTNLLDSIYYCSFTRSYFNKSDTMNQSLGTAGFRLHANFEKKGDLQEVTVVLRESGKKEVMVNGEQLDRFSQHLGALPVVMICPDDISLVNDGPEERRKYMDTLFSQLDSNYLQALIDYNKVLQQRNGLLKWMAEKNSNDSSLLDVYDQQLAEKGSLIYSKRKSYLTDLLPRVGHYYATIAGVSEDLVLQYQSQLHMSDHLKLLRAGREKDRILQRTGTGIHRDDIAVLFKEESFKSMASQGLLSFSWTMFLKNWMPTECTICWKRFARKMKDKSLLPTPIPREYQGILKKLALNGNW